MSTLDSMPENPNGDFDDEYRKIVALFNDERREVHRKFDELEQHFREAIAVFDKPEPPHGFAHMVASNWWWVCVIVVGFILGASLYFLMPGAR